MLSHFSKIKRPVVRPELCSVERFEDVLCLLGESQLRVSRSSAECFGALSNLTRVCFECAFGCVM